MTETLRHRGPDAGDVWVEAQGGAALGQRRLAIIDLSPGGAQPMHSADRRHVITFNGEIYNYRDIRRELEAAGRSMRSDSDTEVLLELLEAQRVPNGEEILSSTLAAAMADCRKRLGENPKEWAWGKLHHGYFEHPLATVARQNSSPRRSRHKP